MWLSSNPMTSYDEICHSGPLYDSPRDKKSFQTITCIEERLVGALQRNVSSHLLRKGRQTSTLPDCKGDCGTKIAEDFAELSSVPGSCSGTQMREFDFRADKRDQI
jgi:hypothetical protein